MRKPVPILFTLPNFISAGSGQAMLNVVERLDRKQFAPAVCVARRGGRLEEKVDRLGIPYIQAPFTVAARPVASLPLRARRAAKPFRKHGFVLWHSFHYLDDYTEPLIAHFAGARAWVYTKKNMSWNRRSWFLRSLLARRVAAQNSDMIRDFFSGAVLRGRARMIPPGVDAAAFRPDVPWRLGLRSRLGTPEDSVVVGCVAHLTAVKGHPTLLSAAALVPQVTLWLAGAEHDSEYAAALKQQVRDLGIADRVFFLGGIGDVPALLAELDVFVLPTQREGCPVALLEAMSAGLACIASDAPGPRDVIESGRNGVLVPTGDVRALADALAALSLDGPGRRAMGLAARELMIRSYSLEGEARAYEEMYSDALGEPMKPGFQTETHSGSVDDVHADV